MRDLESNLSLDTILTSQNVAEDLDDTTLEKIGIDVVESFEVDKRSRHEWETQNEQWMKLAYQILDDKSFPWPNAANVKYPLITIAAIQFAARAYPALIEGSSIVKGRVIGKPTREKEASAERVGTYMSYQVLEEMEEWEEDMDKLLHIIPVIGSAFKKTYFNTELDRNVSELVLPKDLVVNYYTKDFKKARRVTHVLYYHKNELEELYRSGFFRRVELAESAYIPNEYGSSFHGVSDEAQGLTQPSYDEDTPFCILEQHRWLDLDGDGYQEPYIISVHKESREVLRIYPRFEADKVFIDNDDKVIRIQPNEFFTQYVFIPDSESGVYGFGFGKLLGPINDTVNTTINQLLDAGTLSNLPSGFLSRGVRMANGNKPLRPGEWAVVNSTSEDLRKGIYPLPAREPSNVLFNLLGMMNDAGQRVGAVSDMMQGQSPGQNQPYSTTVRVLEEGLRVFSSIHKRIHRALKSEYRKLFKLNSTYLDPEHYFTVLDEGSPEEAVVYQADFDLESVNVVPASDPNIVSETQKIMKSEAQMQLAMQGLVNPQVATRNLLEAQNQPGIEELMEMPEPQPDFETQLKMEQFQHQVQMDQAELEMKMMELEVSMLKDRANALLALSKAESLDNKIILEQVKVQLQAMEQREADLARRIENTWKHRHEQAKLQTQSALKMAEVSSKRQQSREKNATDVQKEDMRMHGQARSMGVPS